MGYLDYAGLQYLWGKLKEKFAPKSHSHDDRYYTEAEMDGKLNSKVNNNEAGANGLINKLSTADGIPNDATVFISQHNDGKTASYYRRPISTLWTYIKGKTDGVYQPKGSYAASGHTHDDRYYTESEMNTKLSGKSNTDHTHKNVNDIGSGKSTTFAYSKAGMNYGDYSWLAGWNGYELRAVNKSQFATAGHTHVLLNHQGNVTAISGTATRTAGLQLYGAYNNGYPMSYGNVICASNGAFGSEIALDCVGGDGKRGPGRMYYRNRSDWGTSEWSDWATVAYLTDKVAGANHADSATTSNGVKDYNDANRTIKIGFAGAGLTSENLNYIAGYTDNGTKIKDVSKDVLKSWIGLGNYLPLIGGTMSGQITKSTGGSWIGDRDRAAIKSSYAGDSSYGAVAAMATKNGYWTMGNLGGNESLIFNYSTDAKYNAGKNETSQVYLPAQAGTIITSATIGSQSVNYANSAGNATNATNAANATTATKLSSNAGSNNQPVYFSGGKPVAIGYTIAKSVPADAKFTDTNTWRGIQNNLTSDSTDQSLSAAQGKALKTLVDGKAPASHKHTKSQITDFPTSMPASDVYAWAKAATKPSYTKAEVGLGNVDNTADKNKSVNYATSAGSATTGLNGVSTCIFDSSSNNGSCVRFYNGLQICFGNSSKSSGVVFKLPFANDSYAVVVGGSDTLKNAWYVAGSRTTTGFNPNQNGFAVLFHWIAIGNWK